jgi:hypothetical protein
MITPCFTMELLRLLLPLLLLLLPLLLHLQALTWVSPA